MRSHLRAQRAGRKRSALQCPVTAVVRVRPEEQDHEPCRHRDPPDHVRPARRRCRLRGAHRSDRGRRAGRSRSSPPPPRLQRAADDCNAAGLATTISSVTADLNVYFVRAPGRQRGADRRRPAVRLHRGRPVQRLLQGPSRRGRPDPRASRRRSARTRTGVVCRSHRPTRWRSSRTCSRGQPQLGSTPPSCAVSASARREQIRARAWRSRRR